MSQIPHARHISVIGLGYVGLPVAIAFAAQGRKVVAFDINQTRIQELRNGYDRTGEVETKRLKTPYLQLTSDPRNLQRADFHIITVPTPIFEDKQPDIGILKAASYTVGGILKKGDIVVYESTVYPGATEEDCVPILEAESGLTFNRDFTVGYSPERINPGDQTHRFETITKVVSGSNTATLDTVAAVYGSVVRAGVHKAPSIKAAEAAKVIENTQRDLNIALMNELALIFDRLGIRTKDVLAAAGTKWNFLPFTPGLVGGHCIGVDPYYLTAKAEAEGYNPEVILAGRRINDGMGAWVAQKLLTMLEQVGCTVRDARVGVLGLTFKENVPDLRNSKVVDILYALRAHGVEVLVHDALADAKEAMTEYGETLCAKGQFHDLDALVLAVPHKVYLDENLGGFVKGLKSGGCLIDVKSALTPSDWAEHFYYWSL